jgi:Ca-activated chloride channel family protein
MKFEPLVSWWLIVMYVFVALTAAGWQIWQIRHQGRKVLVRWLRRAALLILPAVLALGPSVPGGTSSPGVSNLDVIFAVDTTPSAGAQDYDGTLPRLDGVKNDILALANKLQGARFEIISFDSDANVVLPFTTDATALSSAVQGLTPEASTYSQGSSIDKPIGLIVQELNNSKAAYPDHERLLFYLGDGEQTVNAPVQSYASIASKINAGAVLGYGTTSGANMLNYTGADGTGTALSYIMTVDPATNKLIPAVSKIDPVALQTIATQLHVAYRDRDKGGPIASAFQASKASLTIAHSQHIVHYLNLYWLVAIPFAGLCFWEWQALVINLFELRKHHSEKQRGGRHA